MIFHCCVIFTKKFFSLICYTGNGIRLGFSSTTTSFTSGCWAAAAVAAAVHGDGGGLEGVDGGGATAEYTRSRPSSILSSRRACWLCCSSTACLDSLKKISKLHLWKPLEQCILYKLYVCSTHLPCLAAQYLCSAASYTIGVHHPASFSSRCFSYDLSLPEPDPNDFFLKFCMKTKSGFLKWATI